MSFALFDTHETMWGYLQSYAVYCSLLHITMNGFRHKEYFVKKKKSFKTWFLTTTKNTMNIFVIYFELNNNKRAVLDWYC